MAIDAGGNITVLYPANWDAPEEAARIDRSSSLVIPRSEDETEFRLRGRGSVELLTLVSTAPLRNALKALQTVARGQGVTWGFLPVEGDDPLEIFGNLLLDVENLSRSSRSDTEIASVDVISRSANRRAFHTNTLAAFSIVIAVESLIPMANGVTAGAVIAIPVSLKGSNVKAITGGVERKLKPLPSKCLK